MNKSLALVMTILCASTSLSAAKAFSKSVNLVTTVNERTSAAFYEDVSSGSSANLEFSRADAEKTAYLVIDTNTSRIMDIEAQLPKLALVTDESVTMAYTTTIKLVAGDGRFVLTPDSTQTVLANSDSFQVFAKAYPGVGEAGVFSFNFDVDPSEFDRVYEGSYQATVNVQLSNPE